MSKERARRRVAREHEAALKAAARAAEAERQERRSRRVRAVRAATTDRLTLTPRGRDTGTLARRRRLQNLAVVVLLLTLVGVVFAVRPDWPARLGALVVAVLAFPVLRLLLFAPR